MTARTVPSPPEPPECVAAFERMPWLLNGTLAPPAAFALEAHLAHCTACREKIARERELLDAIRRPPSRVEHSPLAAWASFEATLATAGRPPQQTPTADAPGARPALGARWRGLRLALVLQAAAIAVLSVALAWVIVARTPGGAAPGWRTVATPDPTLAGDGVAWRVAFATTVPPRSASAVLAAHGLRVVGEPSPDAVYTVVPAPGGTPAIDALRADPRVRLVQPVSARDPHGAQP